MSLVHYQLVSEMFDHFKGKCIKFFDVKVFYALVMCKFSSDVISVTNLACYWQVWAFYLDMLMELSSCKVLEFFSVANVTSKFRTMELRVHLEFTKSFPNDFRFSIWMAFMGEFTKINTVLQDFVDWLKEFTSFLTIRAASI